MDTSQRIRVKHGDKIITIVRGRAYLHVGGYSVNHESWPETDAYLAERVADWRSRRDVWGSHSGAYTVTALTIAQVEALFQHIKDAAQAFLAAELSAA